MIYISHIQLQLNAITVRVIRDALLGEGVVLTSSVGSVVGVMKLGAVTVRDRFAVIVIRTLWNLSRIC